MPIEYKRIATRKSVGWFGVRVPDDGRRVFEERDYLVRSCTDEMLEDTGVLSTLSAIIFTDLGTIAADLERHAGRLLDFDCRIILRLPPSGLPRLIKAVNRLRIPIAGMTQPESKLLRWQDYRKGDPPAPHAVYLNNRVPWAEIANSISENPPGPPPGQALNVSVEDEKGADILTALGSSAELLIRRAFSDCLEVHLSRIVKGNSGVDVYRACSVMNGVPGTWPQPRFVKLGDRRKILSEYENYVEQVEQYIPFHLGPHLVRERCGLGAKEGILVGDFVEESEDLCGSAPGGRAGSAIACLFDRTLLGWHRGATAVEIPITQLVSLFPRKIDGKRMAEAQRLGATLDLSALRKLFMRCSSTPVLRGPIHGDLHSGNVRVRGTDAIIIDFVAHRSDYPLIYDAACLEAGLLVNGFGNEVKDPVEWLRTISPLYETHPLTRQVSGAYPNNRAFWFYSAVGQIRRYAIQWERGEHQYAGMLALALLKKAEKDSNAPEPGAYLRAGAYVLAEKILTGAFGASAAP